MSIVTRKGDRGSTALMYNRSVSKCSPRVEAYGTVDELNATLGMARAMGQGQFQDQLILIQKDLVAVMGELATAVEDLPRYRAEGHPLIGPAAVAPLEALVREIEAAGVSFRGWATPGQNLAAASLDFARTVCRRAERMVCGLQESGQLHNDNLLVYLNRLSDLLWLMARAAEAAERSDASPGAA